MRHRALVAAVPLLLAACAGVAGLDDFTIVDAAAGGPDAALDAPAPALDAAVADVAAPACTPPALTNPSTAPRAVIAPTVDGELGEWPCASFSLLDTKSAGQVTGSPSSSAQFAVQWNETGVWFACDVIDSNPEGTSPFPYANDACELYLGIPPADGSASATDFHFVVDWRNQAFNYSATDSAGSPLPSGVKTATTSSATGFDVEIFVPASALGYTPEAALVRLFDVQLDDTENGVVRAGALWAYQAADTAAGSCGLANPQPACDTLVWGALDFAP